MIGIQVRFERISLIISKVNKYFQVRRNIAKMIHATFLYLPFENEWNAKNVSAIFVIIGGGQIATWFRVD